MRDDTKPEHRCPACGHRERWPVTRCRACGWQATSAQRGCVELLMLLAVALLCVSIFGFALWWDESVCTARWKDSGYPVRWSLWGDCQIKRPGGTWVPADRVRDVL